MSLTPDFSDKRTLEKYSSAFTLSDMEIFVFPELLLSPGNRQYHEPDHLDMAR